MYITFAVLQVFNPNEILQFLASEGELNNPFIET